MYVVLYVHLKYSGSILSEIKDFCVLIHVQTVWRNPNLLMRYTYCVIRPDSTFPSDVHGCVGRLVEMRRDVEKRK